MASIEITTLESVGALQLSGVDVTLNQVITKADIDAGNLKFVPVANANGSSYDSFAFSVNDGTTDSTSIIYSDGRCHCRERRANCSQLIPSLQMKTQHIHLPLRTSATVTSTAILWQA